MIAIDTNVLVAFRSRNAQESQLASTALLKASQSDWLCSCGVVFSEMLGMPGRHADDLRQFFDGLGVQIDWEMGEADWETAGLAYQGYVERRKKSGGGAPRLIATDFLIGAHAMVRNRRLLTQDEGLYRAAFPGLRIETF